MIAFAAAAGAASPSCAAPRSVPGGNPLRSHDANYELQVIVDGDRAQTFHRDGQTYVLGQLGARYILRVTNNSGRRIEAVVSVDGLDAMDGKAADVRNKRGYLVPAWESVDIEGWRLSQAQVAAFRFSSVPESYAARTGAARDVGVIGVAVFPERPIPPPRPLYTPPRHSDSTPHTPRDAETRRSGAPLGSLLEGVDGGPRHQPQASNEKSGSGALNADAAKPPASVTRGEAAEHRLPSPARRPGLGTEFGESVASPVQEVAFARANPTRPSTILGVRYNDRQGLVALGINVDSCCENHDDLVWRQTATPFPASDRRRYSVPPAGWPQGCCVRY